MKVTVKKYKDYAQLFVDDKLSAMIVAMANGTWRLKDLNDNPISNVNYPTVNDAKKAYVNKFNL